MNRGKENQIVGLTFILALGVCCACWGQAVADDPNGPAPADANTPWDPAAHLAPAWESVALTSRIYSPAESRVRDPLTPERTLSVSGRIDILDPNNLIGLSTTETAVVALDQGGNNVGHAPANDRPSYMRWYEPPHVMRRPTPDGWVSEVLPSHFSVSLTLDPNGGYPLLLSRLEWSMYALLTDQYETVDLPFQATHDWVPIVPGLEVLVEQVGMDDTNYQYRLKARYNVHAVAYLEVVSLNLTAGEVVPTRILVAMQLLDDQGKPVNEGGGGFGGSTSISGSGDERVATSSGSGSCSACGTVTTIRWRFAVKPYEHEVRFVLEDIPVPTF